jgi:hypothetical protein
MDFAKLLSGMTDAQLAANEAELEAAYRRSIVAKAKRQQSRMTLMKHYPKCQCGEPIAEWGYITAVTTRVKPIIGPRALDALICKEHEFRETDSSNVPFMILDIFGEDTDENMIWVGTCSDWDNCGKWTRVKSNWELSQVGVTNPGVHYWDMVEAEQWTPMEMLTATLEASITEEGE